MTAPLRLVVYDRTDSGPLAIPRIERDPDGTAHGTGGLTRYWRIGAFGHRTLGRATAVFGASAWDDALTQIVAVAHTQGAPIAELQAWGHGGWGHMRMGSTRLDEAMLASGGERGARIDALRDVLAPGATVWLRCCSAFGHTGRSFAERLADRLGARVVGHTYIIGFWQSGTHSVAAGTHADWPLDEGVDFAGGVARGARLSSASEPRTVTCLRGGLPAGW